MHENKRNLSPEETVAVLISPTCRYAAHTPPIIAFTTRRERKREKTHKRRGRGA